MQSRRTTLQRLHHNVTSMARQWHVKCHVNGSTDSKVVSQRNDSNIEKIERYIKEKGDY